MKYNPNEIDAKWQKNWANNQTFAASNTSIKPKYYILDMFPYPSGAGLHVGHPLGYIASDIVARFKRHKGFNVLHPQGYDSFGLPAEQYAIQTGQHPDKTTKENIARYREQLDKIGFSFDWSREIRTSNANYYKHTQWIFIQLFNSWYNKSNDKAEDITTLISLFQKEGNTNINAVCDDNIAPFSAQDWTGFSSSKQQKILLQYRLTYLAETEVNWCPGLGTVLANDEIINGVSERGGHPVIRKKMTQWSMRISAYAERLLQGLNDIDWSESIKESQRNWIGKSVGAMVSFKVKNQKSQVTSEATLSDLRPSTLDYIEVFTTRPDTIFGVTFMTLAPEHPLVQEITTPEQKAAIEAYIEKTAKRSERERMADVKTISGVFTGAYAEHPFTKEQIPVWIGDYVLAGYGTGAVMAVPCGDERDYAFANFFKGQNGMPEIKNIFDNVDIATEAYGSKDNVIIANSDFLNGLNYKQATKKAIAELETLNQGKGKTNYRLRDAVFSRQRYWGEPFPVYYVNGLPQMIDAKHLPIALPEVEKYLPTEDGLPPLGNSAKWAWNTITNEVDFNENINNTTIYPLELNTMPGWAGSSWYWMRYMDPHNDNEFASPEAIKYWESVDLYIGGSEHATGHLLYARFWNKFLKDKGYAPTEEPFKKLINQGMILGNSAFVYRSEDSKKLYSKGLISDKTTQAIHVDLAIINETTNELDIEAFKKHPLYSDYANAEFILENGKYIVGREVEKMSKSKYNVVNPDDICNEYGADTLRLYEMFLGPLEQSKPWNTAGITGVFGFLKKLWRLYFDDNGLIVTNNEPSKESLKSLHKTIKKVTEDIENFSFNTSVSQFMICVNELGTQNCHERAILEPLAIILSPYAPHIAEELWSQLGNSESISTVAFPICHEKYLVESDKEYPVSFNGKMKFTINLPLDLTPAQIEEIIMKDERTIKQLDGNTPKKVIIIPGKVINLVG
ncbi:leucyl-tRNA synthetase [Flavobacterium psychrophilum]|uniref:Leucine--tRNA ligase n=2 Tax=Flavobacterium psychrophilum TaxID=96345 RepID=SYL_FLAPJ|nr:leucine--tRNA ligase [Flavobacterium psychrophilum]A6H244.1 RecName: Full=Leucine--tRNA ligase; AltName: Full=Leucyl-tRNA synthetase; Short=LeuRS [Flavobacterium psychrophilum JIP02/86]AIG31088.1 leucyl-tRNA synthetase [Flavobacterium psychrophilum]AIG33365.1 leucyl-tRNA synthetase [Flavobacterium psychrophilum]AIG35515.1 leucyl-tRNA synthetase [Flavobacterium psychrophilum]AIG37876.1 leucyl-tRNA synthetase [Flavobacterium psychrophilum]AIG40147.1 leucyl-tRNA synthetase [Flavobacterium psy